MTEAEEGRGSEHLSSLALDTLRLGQPAQESQRAHLASCATCAAELRGEEATLELPPWLGAAMNGTHGRPLGLGLGQPATRARRLRWMGLSAGSLVLAGAAALMLMRLPSRPMEARDEVHDDRQRPGVREKGFTPATRLYVKRGDEVWVWDGKRRIRPGDRLRLEIHAAGFTHVSVASTPAAGTVSPTLLHQGYLDAGAALLPISFKVDEQRGPEVISVVLADGPIPAGAHDRAARDPSELTTWRKVLVLEKENAP